MMTLMNARTIVKAYDGYVSARGREWADQHYLRKGTTQYEANRHLVTQARRRLRRAKEQSYYPKETR